MKKVISLFLCVAMVVCFMPGMVWAGSVNDCLGGDRCTHQASINNTHYDTLADAISGSVSGDTIKLLQDIDNSVDKEGYTGGINYILKDGTTLDGNGHAISGAIGIGIPSAGATVTNVNFINIHNDTVVDAKTCEKYGWESKIGNQSAIVASKLTGKAVITNCTFDNIDWDAIQITPTGRTAKAEIEITGNIFRHTNEETMQVRYVHVEHDIRATLGTKILDLTITDNQFYSSKNSYKTTSIGIWYIHSGTPNQVSGNYIEDISTAEPSKLGVKSLYPLRSNPEEDIDDIIVVAYSGSKVYKTLQSAIDDPEVKSIYLCYDVDEKVEIPDIGRTIVLSPSEYRLNGEIVNNGSLKIDTGSSEGTANVKNNGKLTLSCNSAASYNIENNGTIIITNGATYDLNKITNNGEITISGGTFTTKPDESMIEEWYIAKGNDGKYKVSKMTVAETVKHGMIASSEKDNSGMFYKSITDAMKNTKVYLQTDTNEDVVVNPKSNYYRDLYLNGHKFTGSLSLQDTCTYLRVRGELADLTNVTGNELKVGTYSDKTIVTIQDAALNSLNIEASGECTVTGGKYQTVTLNEYYKKGENTPKYSGKLLITGGTFASNEVTIAYTNHTLENGEKSENVPIINYLSEGYTLIHNEDGTYTVTCGNHTPSENWNFNETQHWNECANCKEVMTLEEHIFHWVVDKNATSTQNGSKHEECTVCGYQKAAVEIPASGVYVPSTPSDNVTNSGATGTDNATTTADINTTASGGTANAVVDQATADKIVDKATSNQSAEVVVDATTSAGTAENTTVTLPKDTVQKIADKTEAEVTVKTDAAEVTLDQKTLEAVASKAAGSTVEIIVEKTKDEAKEMVFELKIVSGGVVIGEFDGGNVKVTVKLNAALAALKDTALTCVHIDDNGIYSKVGGAKNNDGTYTFVTTHFSSYAIMAEKEADKVIAEQEAEHNAYLKAGVEKTTLKIYSSKGDGFIKIRWTKSKGFKVDGYELYRGKTKSSMKKYDTTKKTSYKNAKYLKKGNRYYYKVRGYRMIGGEKVYTKWSKTIYRIAK